MSGLVGSHVLAPSQVPAPEMDGMLVFGFCIAFTTVVFLTYRREIKTRVPVLAVLLGASAAYGFLQGAWPLGLLLCGLAGREVWCWWRGLDRVDQSPQARKLSHRLAVHVPESRMSRMFGA
jgi:predicted branched-subunit amino acid permease